jgi:molybdopterin synthase catalytic subunit
VVSALPDLEALLQSITLKTTGGACVFAGMVRGETHRDQAHETTRLEYEAYAPMAEAKLAQVADEIRARWPDVEGLALVHRVGVMNVGEPIVYVACTSAHRDTGLFDAAKYGIDRLKEIVPIWKKEMGPSGEMWVEGDYHPKAGE